MRVAITADEIYPAIGGSPTSTMELSEALAGLGVQPVLITHAYPGQPAREEIGGVEVRRLEGLVLPRANRGVPGALFLRLHQCLKEGDFDIVHGQDIYSPTSLASVYSAGKCGVPSVITCRSVHESTALWRLAYQPLVYWLRRADRVIAVSRASKRFCHALGVLPDRTVVVLNGIPLSRFNPGVDGTPMSERLGLGNGPIIATAIRLVKRKGPYVLVDAFGEVLETRPGAKLVLAGSGPEFGRLRDRVGELGMGNSVCMTGPLSREAVAQLMSMADVFVLPSQIEAFGRAAVEAAAIGTPVVCPRAGGMPEAVLEGFGGLMFNPTDGHDLANAILRLLLDESLAAHISGRGRRAAQRLSLRKTAKRTLGLYEEMREQHG
jgi:glycosyltransferase involved in cell wall biosynthesis